MSIRILTDQLQQETTEFKRNQQFNSVRSVPQQEPQGQTQQTPFMVGAGKKKETVQETPTPPAPTQTPKIGLKERESQSPYDIPGGIAARFGRNALKEPIVQPSAPAPIVEVEPEPVQKTITENQPEATEQTTDTTETQEQERANEEDDAARITIELQSH